MTNSQKAEITALRAKNISYSQIALKLGISQSAVKSFFHRLAQSVNDTSICANCGAKLTLIPHKRIKKFCSDRCRYAYWNKNKTGNKSVCAYCGAEFDNKGKSSRKFCNVKCYTNSRWGEIDGQKAISK